MGSYRFSRYWGVIPFRMKTKRTKFGKKAVESKGNVIEGWDCRHFVDFLKSFLYLI